MRLLGNGRTVGEGSGRNTRAHASEESDSGIVPMNHLNKIEQSIRQRNDHCQDNKLCYRYFTRPQGRK